MSSKSFQPGRGYTKEDWDAVSDNPEVTAERLANAKSFAETFPDLTQSAQRVRGRQKAPTKKLISIRLDPQVVDRFKATGPGWQGRINEILKQNLP